MDSDVVLTWRHSENVSTPITILKKRNPQFFFHVWVVEFIFDLCTKIIILLNCSWLRCFSPGRLLVYSLLHWAYVLLTLFFPFLFKLGVIPLYCAMVDKFPLSINLLLGSSIGNSVYWIEVIKIIVFKIIQYYILMFYFDQLVL